MKLSDWAQKYFCAQSQTRISIGFGTGRLRVESQGLLFRSCKLGRFDFLMTQLVAPGSPRMRLLLRPPKISVALKVVQRVRLKSLLLLILLVIALRNFPCRPRPPLRPLMTKMVVPDQPKSEFAFNFYLFFIMELSILSLNIL